MPPPTDSDALLRETVAVIDRARRNRGMTQDELGVRSGIGQSTVSKYFRLRLRLNISQFDAMCQVLGLTPAAVIGEADAMRQPAR